MTEPEAYHLLDSLCEGCATMGLWGEWNKLIDLLTHDKGWTTYP